MYVKYCVLGIRYILTATSPHTYMYVHTHIHTYIYLHNTVPSNVSRNAEPVFSKADLSSSAALLQGPCWMRAQLHIIMLQLASGGVPKTPANRNLVASTLVH